MSDVVVAQLQHSQGAVNLASLPYLSSDNIPYDNWLGPTVFEYGLSDQLGIGDLRAFNAGTERWQNFDFRGFRARIWRGEETLPIEQLTPIATAQITGLRIIDQNEFEWQLRTDAQIYNRTFHEGADAVENHTVQDAFEWLLNQYPVSQDEKIPGRGAIDFINIPAATLAKPLEFDVTENTLMIDLIEQFADSIGAAYRISHIGHLEIVKPDTSASPVIDLDISSVIGRPSAENSIPAVRRVIVSYNRGNDRIPPIDTGARTGLLDEEVLIESLLTTAADAQELGDQVARLYSNRRDIWDINAITGLPGVLQPGDYVSVSHPTFTGIGIIDHTRITPPSYIQQLEVISQ